jgi:hypothetical protein
MFSLRDVLIFFAGAQFFHTLSHILLPFFVKLPMDMAGITVTETLNMWAIIINGILMIGLLWWAKKASK